MKNCKKTLAGLASITKRFLILPVYFIVLCSASCAQSTFFSPPDSTGFHAYLTPSEPAVHGFGVAFLSGFYPDSSFIKAYNLAIEDLRANLFTSVYMETFKTTMINTHYEYAIKDSIDLKSVAKIDSVSKSNLAYFFVQIDSVRPEGAHIPNKLPSEINNWTDEFFQPVLVDNFWISAGYEDFSRYDPYGSWAQSKLNALNALAGLLQTKVQSTTRTYNAFSRQITYITSRVIFENIVVLKRLTKGGQCHTLLAVHENDITMWE